MLDLTASELRTIFLDEFLERVAGKLLWNKEQQEQQLKAELEFSSWFTANIMQSSGNYKKGVDAVQLKESIYDPESMFNPESNKEKTEEEKKIEYSQGKQELLDRFGLEE